MFEPTVHRGKDTIHASPVQTDPTLFRYALVIREREKCFKLWTTAINNTQQSVQTDAKSNIQQCWGVIGQ